LEGVQFCYRERPIKHESWIEISELSIQDDYTMMMRIQDEVDYFSDLADKFPDYFNVKMIGLCRWLTADEDSYKDLLAKFESLEEDFESQTAQQLASQDLRLAHMDTFLNIHVFPNMLVNDRYQRDLLTISAGGSIPSLKRSWLG
jgi:hypothetical protein